MGMGMGNASRRRGADTSYQRDDDVARYRVEAVRTVAAGGAGFQPLSAIGAVAFVAYAVQMLGT